MKLLKLIPDETAFQFTKLRWHALALTLFSFVASIVAIFVVPGLNFGVDFRGGITIEVSDSAPIDIGTVRNAVGELGFGETKVQEFGSPNDIIVILEQTDASTTATSVEAGQQPPAGGDTAQQAAAARVQAALREALGEDIVFRRVDVVGPTVSEELVGRGLVAIALATGMMLIYIWFRFQWQWGLGAVLGVIHDTVITVGIFTLFGFEFNLTIIAAILTVIGYSINDTVVVYARIRENLRKYKKMQLAELIDLSLNETLTRTVVTGGTAILALAALIAVGGEVLRGFCVVIMFGIIVGTYSSIFVCAPFLLLTGVKRDWSKVPAAATP
jgi:preprotein translocase SecF subunit